MTARASRPRRTATVLNEDLATALAGRVRAALDREAHGTIAERRMFGVLAFLHNGNMLGYVSEHGLTIRLARNDEAAARIGPSAQRCVVSGRRMPGYVLLEHSVVKTDRQLETWLQRAFDYVGSLPRKEVSLEIGFGEPGRRPATKNKSRAVGRQSPA